MTIEIVKNSKIDYIGFYLENVVFQIKAHDRKECLIMAFSKEMLEYLHDSGQMLDWAYY